MFHAIDDCFVILREKGMFRQAAVFRRGHNVYAGIGQRFVQLMGQGGTSKPTMSWEDLTASPIVAIGRFGAPVVLETAVARIAIAAERVAA